MRRACTVAVLLWVLLSVGLFIATAVHGASLTPAQAQIKASVCAAFNSNAVAPIAQLTRPRMAAGCPWVAA